MFNFGRPEDTVELYWQNALNLQGPRIPDCHYDEMESQDLKNLFAYLYIVLEKAHRDGADEEVVRIVTECYDEVFQARADTDPAFRDAVKTHRHRFLPDFEEETLKKYKQMAGVWTDQ